MLQYPINVYPDNVSFDPTNDEYDRGLHFTFKGDVLSAIFLRVFNYDTQEKILDTVLCNPDLTPIAYNNEDVDYRNLFTFLDNKSKSYIVQMMFGQVYKHATNVGFWGIYDRFVSRGEILHGAQSGSRTITIEDNIQTICEWNVTDGICEPNYVTVDHGDHTENVYVADMIIKINNENYPIESYNRNTGALTLRFELDEDVDDGTPYQIYSSYLITEQYFFQTAKTPSIANVETISNALGLNFSAYYWQDQRKMLKYYTLSLYKENFGGTYTHIKTTPKIYTQKIDYNFVDDYDFEGTGGNSETKSYKIVFNGVMQNGMTISEEYDFMAIRRSNIAVIESPSVSARDNVTVSWSETSQGVMLGKAVRVYRSDVEGLYNQGTSPYKTYKGASDKKLVGDVSGGVAFTDYTASAKANYRYMLVPYDDGASAITIYKAVRTDAFATDMDGYRITAIRDSGYDADNLPFYYAGDTWKFVADIEDTTMTQNVSNELHVGYGKYSSMTSTDVDYLSGTVSGMLGYLDCTNKKFVDDIELVKAWRRFIAQGCKFILKSPKGDVWLVNIIETPTTAYQEDASSLPTRFTFSWAECGSADDLLVGDVLPYNSTERR